MAEDEGGSGLDKRQYAWSESNETEPIDWGDFEDGEEISRTNCELGEYYLWTKVTDKTGNRAERTKL